MLKCSVDDAEEDVEEDKLKRDHDHHVNARSHVRVAFVHLVDHALVFHYNKYDSNDGIPNSAELMVNVSIEQLAATTIPQKNDHQYT